jgi:hypothetical protein
MQLKWVAQPPRLPSVSVSLTESNVRELTKKGSVCALKALGGTPSQHARRVRCPFLTAYSRLSLAVAAFYVLGGFGFFGIEEEVLGAAVFNHFAEEHEDAFIAGAAGLSHVVGDDENAVAAAQFK